MRDMQQEKNTHKSHSIRASFSIQKGEGADKYVPATSHVSELLLMLKKWIGFIEIA